MSKHAIECVLHLSDAQTLRYTISGKTFPVRRTLKNLLPGAQWDGETKRWTIDVNEESVRPDDMDRIIGILNAEYRSKISERTAKGVATKRARAASLKFAQSDECDRRRRFWTEYRHTHLPGQESWASPFVDGDDIHLSCRRCIWEAPQYAVPVDGVVDAKAVPDLVFTSCPMCGRSFID